MADTLVRPQSIDAPPITPLKGTLLDVATVHDGMSWVGPTDLWPTYNCAPLKNLPAFCYVGSNTNSSTAKDLTGAPNWIDGNNPFGVYLGVTCKPFGFPGLSAVRPAFEAREHLGVEAALMSLMAATVPAGNILTPKASGAVSVALGIAALEEHAACNYAGAPTIHMQRGIASLYTQFGNMQFEGNRLVTPLGSKVAAGACYNTQPTGSPAPAADERWLYATGEVVLWRGDVQANEAFDQTHNDMSVLVERTYMAAIDCYLAAVKVTVS